MKIEQPSTKKLKNMSLNRRAEMALKEAVAEAIAEHKLRGHAIWVWRRKGREDTSGRNCGFPG